MSNYGIRPDTTPWRDRGDYYILPKDDPVAALNILREAAGLDDWSPVGRRDEENRPSS